MKQDKKAFYPNYNEPQVFQVTAQPKSILYRIEIDDVIETVGQFSDAIRVLGLCKEDDVCEIHLSSPGGSIDATDALLHAIHNCDGHTHAVAVGGCHSATSHILLSVDSFELSDGFNCLLHAGQDGAYGTVSEYAAKSKFDADFRIRQFRNAYAGFLSETEMDDMLNGKDIWLDAQGWVDRYTARYEYFKTRAEEMQATVLQLEKELAESSEFTPVGKAKLTKPRKKAAAK